MNSFVNFLLSWGSSVNTGLTFISCFVILGCIIAGIMMIAADDPSDLEDIRNIVTSTSAFKYLVIVCAVAAAIVVFFPGGDAWDALKNTPTNMSDCIQMCRENFTK